MRKFDVEKWLRVSFLKMPNVSIVKGEFFRADAIKTFF